MRRSFPSTSWPEWPRPAGLSDSDFSLPSFSRQNTFTAPISTWTSAGVHFQQNGNSAQVVKYDSRQLLRGVGVFRTLFARAGVATVFASRSIRNKALMMLLLAFAVRYIFGVERTQSEKRPFWIPERAVNDHKAWLAETSVDLIGLVDFLSGSLTFLLGLYISSAVSRWWDMRVRSLAVMWGAVDDLCLWAGAWLSSGSDADFAAQRLVRRYGLLAMRLLFKQADGTDEQLQALIDEGLLLGKEADALQGKASKPQIIWVWMAKLWQQLLDSGRIPQSATNAPLIMAKCVEGRGSAGLAFVYIGTQLPYAYSHLLSLVANVTQVLMAVAVGIACAGTDTPLQAAPVPVARLLLFLTIFDGLLAITVRLENPFSGHDVMDFPNRAFHLDMAKETAAFTDCANIAGPKHGWWTDAFAGQAEQRRASEVQAAPLAKEQCQRQKEEV
eukprot:TRINITY_DN29088_c0_g2_i1.p1 TRINITY_DN29088_c0_g2~~TRINITY_DN29088_c0_g2_i1.p1  ORF type:complete len:443 (-),score=88.59 TRINITY_DN29088_c0_g2_i1:126-1454(-)